MKKLIAALVIVGTTLLSGCSHPIQLNPKTDGFKVSENKINKTVGYHISEADRVKKVTTPGGGGDKVSYTPYKDVETALYAVLSNKFSQVYSVKSLEDKTFIKENEIALVFLPVIETNSSSSSLITWPPTKFTINLSCKAIDANGNTVWEKVISSEGEAEFSEFKSDFSLSARRATEKLFIQLAKELETVDVLTVNN